MTLDMLSGLEQALRSSLQAAARASPRGAPAPASELLLATIYATVADDVAGLARLGDLIEGSTPVHPAFAPWRALIGLAQSLPSLDALPSPAAFAGAPAFSAFVVAGEVARLLWRVCGSRPAWQWLLPREPATLAQALRSVDELQRDSPLLVSGCATLLDLSAANGAWHEHQEILRSSSTWWVTGTPQAVRVALAQADGCLVRGRYGQALRLARDVCAHAHGDLRSKRLAVTLHALVGLGRAASSDAASVVREFAASDRLDGSAEWRLDVQELERTRRLFSNLVSLDSTLAGYARDAGVDAGSTRETHDVEADVMLLLEAERRARCRNTAARNAAARRRELLDLTRHAEDLLQDPRVGSDPSASIHLRLLWCRLVVDMTPDRGVDGCRHVLDGVVDEARELGLAPLEMRALEQRAALLSRSFPSDWEAAVLDGTRAARIALDLLEENARGGGAADNTDRSLLESLMPVFDRVIQTHAEGALRIAAAHPALERPQVPIDERVWNDVGVRGSWARFGRLLQGFAEKEQALALDEGRRSYADNRTIPLRFITLPEAPSTLPLEEIRQMLRPRDAVLQYFLVGPYLLRFVYGRRFFEWRIHRFDADGGAEVAVADLVDRARAWARGGAVSEDESATALQSALVPNELYETLRLARVDHLRIVPHGALYRVPFGRLAPSGTPLIEQHSISLHATGKWAAKSAVLGAQAGVLAPRTLAYVWGPEPGEGGGSGRSSTHGSPTALPQPVACAAAEESSLRRAVGRFTGLAVVDGVDGATQPLDGVIDRLQAARHSILHLTCHGSEGGAHGQVPKLLLGREGAKGLGADRISTLSIDACRLVFLQSCSTGWMDHERANPVQGIPQAFLDAGARAVIAPLSMVPMVLAAPFASVFYRALRFLSPERALSLTLRTFRRYGPLLVRHDRRAEQALARHGGAMDSFEYRFLGVTGMALGSWPTRASGWLAFRWFEWSLRVQSAKG